MEGLIMHQSAKALSRFLSLGDVADLLGVSPKTVMRRIEAGHLRCHRMGRQIRISTDDYENYVARQRL